MGISADGTGGPPAREQRVAETADLSQTQSDGSGLVQHVWVECAVSYREES